MVKVFVEEEYGYRLWVWAFPGNIEDLIVDWMAGKAPINFFNPSVGKFAGEMRQVATYRQIERETEEGLYIHIHEDNDTFLGINEQIYPAPDRNFKKMAMEAGVCPKLLDY